MSFLALTPSQTDAKSPIDDVLMDTIRLDLDVLYAGIVGVVTTLQVGDYTALETDVVIIFDCTTADRKLTIPDGTGLVQPHNWIIIKIGLKTLTIASSGGNTFYPGDTASDTSITLSEPGSINIHSNKTTTLYVF